MAGVGFLAFRRLSQSLDQYDPGERQGQKANRDNGTRHVEPETGVFHDIIARHGRRTVRSARICELGFTCQFGVEALPADALAIPGGRRWFDSTSTPLFSGSRGAGCLAPDEPPLFLPR
jgi:hypothetical protein